MSVKTAHSKIRINFLISVFVIMNAVTFAATHSDSNKINTLSDIFTKGQFHGQIRNYYMATIHHSALPNYWTNAVGSSLHYQTASIHGFTAGITGNISYKTFSSELYNNETPGLSAKWESELYDRNETEFDQLHSRFNEIYLRYSTKKLSIKAGRQNINQAPLLQQLDGRMMPFVYQGIWSEYQHDEGKTYLGLINGVGPRGMTNWYSLNEGIGIIGKGLQPNGTPSNYYKKSNTRGLIVAGHEQKIGDNWKINYWTNWLDRIYGIQWFESHFENENMIAGIQYVFQHALPKQKELEYNQRYYQPGENANILAARLGMKISKWQLTGNYLHSFEGGRFLYPRELGRDNFFTSEPRSWQDGFGKSKVFKIKANYQIENKKTGKLDGSLAFNRVFSITQNDFENNKYNIPPYNQITTDIRYSFTGLLKGLDIRFIYIYRITDDNIPVPDANKFYRTDFSHYNLIANINF